MVCIRGLTRDVDPGFLVAPDCVCRGTLEGRALLGIHRLDRVWFNNLVRGGGSGSFGRNWGHCELSVRMSNEYARGPKYSQFRVTKRPREHAIWIDTGVLPIRTDDLLLNRILAKVCRGFRDI